MRWLVQTFQILVLDCILAWAGVVDELDFAQRLSSWVKHGFPELGDSEGHMHSPTIEKVWIVTTDNAHTSRRQGFLSSFYPTSRHEAFVMNL